MKEPNFWQNRLQDLVDRSWDVETIRKRLDRLRQNGFGPKDLDWKTSRLLKIPGDTRSALCRPAWGQDWLPR